MYLTQPAIIAQSSQNGVSKKMVELFVGIDGGGSHSSYCLIDQNGSVVNTTISGCTNKYSVGEEIAKKFLYEGFEDLLKDTSFTKQDVKGIFGGLSGVDRPEDTDIVAGWIKEWASAGTNIKVVSDTVVGLASGTDGVLEGIILISGTGTIACGYKLDGSKARAGGWGPAFGDCGSGYWLGAELLRAVARGRDGTDPPTILDEMLQERIGDAHILKWAYAEKETGNWQRTADLAPLVFEAYKKKDKAAVRIIDQAAEGLVEQVKRVAEALQLNDPFTLVTVGGILLHPGSPVLQRVQALVQQYLPQATVSSPKIPIEQAAALLAKNL